MRGGFELKLASGVGDGGGGAGSSSRPQWRVARQGRGGRAGVYRTRVMNNATTHAPFVEMIPRAAAPALMQVNVVVGRDCVARSTGTVEQEVRGILNVVPWLPVCWFIPFHVHLLTLKAFVQTFTTGCTPSCGSARARDRGSQPRPRAHRVSGTAADAGQTCCSRIAKIRRLCVRRASWFAALLEQDVCVGIVPKALVPPRLVRADGLRRRRCSCRNGRGRAVLLPIYGDAQPVSVTTGV